MPKVRLENYDFLRSCRKLKVLNLSRTNLSASYALENLSQVTILDLPPADFDDFSFLLKCRSLEIVDLSQTNFRDCAILAQMPELKRVFLPAERQLLHRELLDPLPIQVKTNPRCIRGDGFPSYELVKPQPVESWDWKPPYTVLHIAYYDINDEEKTWQGREITQKVVEKLMKKIRKKKLDELYLSLQYWGEEEDMVIAADGALPPARASASIFLIKNKKSITLCLTQTILLTGTDCLIRLVIRKTAILANMQRIISSWLPTVWRILLRPGNYTRGHIGQNIIIGKNRRIINRKKLPQ